MRNFLVILASLCLGFWLIACTSNSDPGLTAGDTDGSELDSEPDQIDGDLDASVDGDHDLEGEEEAEAEEEPLPFNPDAAAMAFKLYYKERVDRAIIAYNRYGIFGDTGFGLTIGKVGVAVNGDSIEVVPGPNDNNMIGLSVWTAWNAYKLFHTRTLALSMIRMFEGLAFMEAVSGHPGLTARCAYPGYTLAINGTTGETTRTRDGLEVVSAFHVDAELENEIVSTFFNGKQFIYRTNPGEFMFDYMPVVEVGEYCTTYGFSMLPDYIRVSDCCTSLKQTPEGYDWQGAFWSNHNSRDNFPDLGLGYVAALEAKDADFADSDVRAAAADAWAAGNRIGDSVQTHEGKLMTVDEHNPYDTLVVAGAVRPDGETESEDLGSLSSCPTAYLAKAISSSGLSLPAPEIPLPGSIEFIMDGLFDECHASEEIRQCLGLDDGYCGKRWSEMEELHFYGHPWLEFLWDIEQNSPGSAETLIGSFQDDYYEITLAMVALVRYAEAVGNMELRSQARSALFDLTSLMRTFADLIYSLTQPDRLASRRYEAALFDTWGGIDPQEGDLGDFARAESFAARLDSMLDLQDTNPAPMMTDEEIRQKVQDRLAGRSDSVKARYAEAYGDEVPVRVAGEGYEAKIHHPENPEDWHAVSRPHHLRTGGFKLFEALPLCNTRPDLLDCSWAVLGCERPDLVVDGKVDEADAAHFNELATTYGDAACGNENSWCEGADLDQSGSVDDNDRRFMTAAEGCWYSRD